MTTSVSRRFNILCIMFKIIAFFILMLFTPLYVSGDISLTLGKHLHDHIISLRVEFWTHQVNLFLPLFIEVPVPSQESEWSCICVLGVLIDCASFYDFDIWFWNCSYSVVLIVFHFYYMYMYYWNIFCADKKINCRCRWFDGTWKILLHDSDSCQ